MTHNQYKRSDEASNVSKYTVGLINCLNNQCMDWIFIPTPGINCDTWAKISYPTIRNIMLNNVDLGSQDFIGIRLGDVSGDWTKD